MVDDVGDGMLQDRDTALPGEVHGCPIVYESEWKSRNLVSLPEDTAAAGAVLKAVSFTAT
jgi:hypothetical protein